MGTWSAAILGNDTAFDVHQTVLEQYDAGAAGGAIEKLIRAKFRATLSIRQDDTNVWFALALGLWEIGALNRSLRVRVERLVASGRDLEVWRELGARPSLILARKKQLAKLVERIQRAPKAPRARRPPAPQLETLFQVGACLSFQFPDRTFGGVLVTSAAFTKKKGGMGLVLTDLKERRRPTFAQFLKSCLLEFEWEEPFGTARRLAAANGKVGRLSQQGLAYDKADQRERFLAACTNCFSKLGQIPPFHHVLFGSGGLGVNPGKAATPAALQRSIAVALGNRYRESRESRGRRSPTLRTLARVLKG